MSQETPFNPTAENFIYYGEKIAQMVLDGFGNRWVVAFGGNYLIKAVYISFNGVMTFTK